MAHKDDTSSTKVNIDTTLKYPFYDIGNYPTLKTKYKKECNTMSKTQKSTCQPFDGGMAEYLKYIYDNHYGGCVSPSDFKIPIQLALTSLVNYDKDSIAEIKQLTSILGFYNGEKRTIEVTGTMTTKVSEFITMIHKAICETITGTTLETFIPPHIVGEHHVVSLLSTALMMDALKKEFEYVFHRTRCGIPFFILEGNLSEWTKIVEWIELLIVNFTKISGSMPSFYILNNFILYLNGMLDIVKRFTHAKETGEFDKEWIKKVVYIEGGGSGHATSYSGWMLDFTFFPNGRPERVLYFEPVYECACPVTVITDGDGATPTITEKFILKGGIKGLESFYNLTNPAESYAKPVYQLEFVRVSGTGCSDF